METAGKGMLLIALADKAQVAGPLVFFGAHVLHVHLGRKESSGPQEVFPDSQASLKALSVCLHSPGRPSDSV